MSPEYGSTCAIFPIDDETLDYLRLTGRSEEQIALVEAYAKEQGCGTTRGRAPLLRVARARPRHRRPVDRRPEAPAGPHRAVRGQDLQFRECSRSYGQRPTTVGASAFPASDLPRPTPRRPSPSTADAGGSTCLKARRPRHVAIASITSCTNTSNPSVMIAAGLLAKKAVEKGLTPSRGSRPPGARLEGRHRLLREGRPVALPRRARLQPRRLRLHHLHRQLRPAARRGLGKAINDNDLAVTAVLSGNRNFEGRINPDVKMNYLASPPLVIAYALAGTMDFDFETEPLGKDEDGNDVFLADIWPSPADVEAPSLLDHARDVREGLRRRLRRRRALAGACPPRGRHLRLGRRLDLRPQAALLRRHDHGAAPVADIAGARVLAKLGDSVTTDHISPAGSIKADSPAGKYLTEHGVERATSTPTARAAATTRS
jgi:aconitate hydratase